MLQKIVRVLFLNFKFIMDKPNQNHSFQNELFPEINDHQVQIIEESIPDQFYENGSDAIKIMLDLLPNGIDPHFIDEANMLQQKFISAVDIVSKNLLYHLQSKYQDVLKAMSLISNLNNQLNLSTQNISILREVLQQADSEICQNPETFFHQIQKQKNLKIVLDHLDFVKQIVESSEKINQALNDNNFVLAIELYLKPAEFSSKVHNLTGVENLISSLHNKYSRILDKMDTALVLQTTIFDCGIYDNLMTAYDNLNQINVVPQKLQEAFITKLDADFNSIANSNSNNNKISKFREMLNAFIKSNKMILSTYHQIVSFHRGNSKYASILIPIEKIAEAIWNIIETNLSSIILKIPIQKMNFEYFNNLINCINDFLQFGGTIVDTTNEIIIRSMNNITQNYFNYFHQNTLESILENIELDTLATIPTDMEFVRQIFSFKGNDNASHNFQYIQINPSSQVDLSKNTNLCISIIKSIHQYMMILYYVPSLSVEIVRCIRELAEYYSFSILNIIFKKFTNKPFEFDQNKQTFKLYDCSLLVPSDGIQAILRIVHHLTNRSTKFIFPTKISNEVNDNYEEFIITAKNNMNTLTWYLNSIRSIIEENLPESSLGSIRRFYSDFVSNFLSRFSDFTYPFLIPEIVDLTSFEQQIKTIKFNKSNQNNEQHQFSKTWMTIAESFNSKLKDIDENDKKNLLAALWNYTSFISINAISLLHNLSQEERSSLIVDFTIMYQYILKFDVNMKINNLIIIEYINASFMAKDQFLIWVENNFNKYTLNQLLAIVDTGLGDKISKKEKIQIQDEIKKRYLNK